MGLYRVLTPCAVGDLHYAQVPAAPIEADDTLAATLVAAGVLAPAGHSDEENRPTGTAAKPKRRTAARD